MKRVCCCTYHQGERVFGEKEPYEDQSESHGICPTCVPLEMARIEEELKRIESRVREAA